MKTSLILPLFTRLLSELLPSDLLRLPASEVGFDLRFMEAHGEGRVGP